MVATLPTGGHSFGVEGCCCSSCYSCYSCFAGGGGEAGAQNQKSGDHNIFNLKSFNELKKDQTNINIFKNSYFDSSFNSVQSLNINLSNLREAPLLLLRRRSSPSSNGGQETKNIMRSNTKLSAILRAIRSIRLNREEWKLIRNINLMEKIIRSNHLTLIEKKVRDTNPAPSEARSASIGVSTFSPCFGGATATQGGEVASPLLTLFLYKNKVRRYAPYGRASQVTLANYRILSFLSFLSFLSEGGASKNILLRNMKYKFLKSTLSSILKKKIRKISEVLEDKPIKNYSIFSYLKNCISLGTPMVLNGMLNINNPLAFYSYIGVAGEKQSPCPSLIRPGPSLAGRYSQPAGGVGAAGAQTSPSRRQGPNLAGPLGCEATFTPTATTTAIPTPSATPIAFPSANFTAIPSAIPSAITSAIPISFSATAHASPASRKLEKQEGDNNSSGAISILQNRSRTKLSLNKNKGRKFGIFIKYKKIIGYKFNSMRSFYKKGPSTYSNSKEATTASPYPFLPLGSNSYGGTPSVATPASQRVEEWNNPYIKNTYKLLFYLFKSMYCLISKPVFKYSNDKITIQLFYYLNIPKKKVFRLFSIYYINSIKKKWLALIDKKKTKFIYAPPLLLQRSKGGSRSSREKVATTYYSEGVAGEIRSKKAGESLTTSSDYLSNYLSQLGATRGEGAGKVPFIPTVSSLDSPIAKLLRAPTKCPPIMGRYLLRKGKATSKVLHLRTGRGHTAKGKFIKWKLRKAISRLLRKNKNAKNLLFKLRKFNLTAIYQNKFKLICAILSNRFNKPVELQLIRLHHPYHDSNILVNLLSLNIKNKRKKARVAIQKIYNKKPVKFLPNLKSSKLIPAFLSGLNIKIAGRLMGEPIIPRITTKVYGKGATATGKVNYLDVARITKKNRKGSYTIKIKSGQNFF